MKKVVLGLLFVGLLVPLAGFAESPVVSSCVKGDLFDRYTGKPCLSTNTTVPGCLAGYKFSPMTGEKCSSVSVPQSCYVFNRNLTIGMSGEDVSKLEQVVIREGFGKAVGGGIFDDALAASVVQLQGKYGILQTGYFGPLTRAKVNSLGCKVVSVDGPILKSAYIDGSKLVLKGSGFGNAPQVRLSGKAYDKTINTSSDGSSITVTIPSDADSDANPYYVWVVSNAYKGGLDSNKLQVKIRDNGEDNSINIKILHSNGQELSNNGMFRTAAIRVSWYPSWGSQFNNDRVVLVDSSSGAVVATLQNGQPDTASLRWIAGTDVSGNSISDGRYKIRVYVKNLNTGRLVSDDSQEFILTTL